MSIGDNIRQLRTIYKLSQDDLAKIAHVTVSAVSTWELGKREPRMGAIQRIADHFGLKKSDIIEDKNAPFPAPAPEPAPDFSPHDIALIEAYHDASDEIQDIVDNTLDRYSKHNLPSMGKEERRKKEEAVG